MARIAPDIRAPYLFQASFSVERELWSKAQMIIEYQTLRGVIYCARGISMRHFGDGWRPDPNFLNINQVESSEACASNALSVTFQGNMGKRLKGMAQYTLSRITDDTSGLLRSLLTTMTCGLN